MFANASFALFEIDPQILDLPLLVNLRFDVRGPDADQVHLGLHIIIPARANRIRDRFLVSTQRSSDRVDRGRTAIGDPAGDPCLPVSRLDKRTPQSGVADA